MKFWNKGQRCLSWIFRPWNKSVWMGLADPHLQEQLAELRNPAAGRGCGTCKELPQHRQLLFGQMFSGCRVLELGGGCCSPCLAQHPTFLCINPSHLPALGDGSPLPPWPKAWYAAGGISELFVLRVKVLATGWDRPEYPTWAGTRQWMLLGRRWLGTAVLMVFCWDGQPGVPGSVTAPACRGDLRGKKDGLGTLFTWRNENIFFLLFANISRAFGPDHERSVFVSLLDFQPFHLKSGLSFY